MGKRLSSSVRRSRLSESDLAYVSEDSGGRPCFNHSGHSETEATIMFLHTSNNFPFIKLCCSISEFFQFNEYKSSWQTFGTYFLSPIKPSYIYFPSFSLTAKVTYDYFPRSGGNTTKENSRYTTLTNQPCLLIEVLPLDLIGWLMKAVIF